MDAFSSGFIKRAQEHGFGVAQAKELVKIAKEDREQKAKDYMPMNLAGAVGDYGSGSFGGYRAGKATALSKALGHDPGFTTTNPRTSSLLGMLGGVLAGGTVGSNWNHTTNIDGANFHSSSTDESGSVLGALGGGLLGHLLPSMLRRHDMKQNLKEYSEGASVHPEKPRKMHGIGNITLPLSGFHRKGEAVGYNKLRGVEEDETPNTMANTIAHINPFASLGAGATQNYSADNTIDKKR